MMCPQKRHRVIVPGREMPEVQIDTRERRHRDECLQARDRRYLVGISHLSVGMIGRHDVVLLGEHRNPASHADSRLVAREELDAEGLQLTK